MDKQLESQTSIMATTQTLSIGLDIPRQIFKDMPDGGGVIVKVPYILMDEYNKLKHELEKSETQIKILHSQIYQNETLKKENERLQEALNGRVEELTVEVVKYKGIAEALNGRIEELTAESVKYKGIVDELTAELAKYKGIAEDYFLSKKYQKVSENLTDVYDGMRTLLCEEGSVIHKKSGDNKLSVLVQHLKESDNIKIGTKKRSRWSKVGKNMELWDTINKETCKILQDEFNITDIKVFYEIVRIKVHRNNLSHTKDMATIEDIKSITKYAKEIFDCIHNT